jgi:hypothetical protein
MSVKKNFHFEYCFIKFIIYIYWKIFNEFIFRYLKNWNWIFWKVWVTGRNIFCKHEGLKESRKSMSGLDFCRCQFVWYLIFQVYLLNILSQPTGKFSCVSKYCIIICITASNRVDKWCWYNTSQIPASIWSF